MTIEEMRIQEVEAFLDGTKRRCLDCGEFKISNDEYFICYDCSISYDDEYDDYEEDYIEAISEHYENKFDN